VEFENRFSVNAPIGEVYDALLDVERVAPAMPGAKVLEKTSDDAYKVSIKVKLGPVTMTYRGDVTIVDRDPSQHSAVLDVKAKEARGQGTANANVSLALEPADGRATRGTMKTTVQLSGKAAAMSRGVIDDVSKRLVEQFAQNLERIVGTPEPVDEVTEDATAEPQPAPPPAQDAFDAGSLAANMATDRIREPRTALGLALGALFLGWLIGRRSR
jgi:uncharacterized protein